MFRTRLPWTYNIALPIRIHVGTSNDLPVQGRGIHLPLQIQPVRIVAPFVVASNEMRPFTCHCSSAGTSSTPSNPTLQRIRAPWPLAESRCWPRHGARLVLQWHGHSMRPSAVVSREALPALRKKNDKVGRGCKVSSCWKKGDVAQHLHST